MARFNLLEEKWILVLTEDGENKKVSIKELFANAHNYVDLAGDTKTQDFAVMRILLAILHTVFSRFNDKGEVYKNLVLDDRYKQIKELKYEEEIDSYVDDLYDTWENLWERGSFPDIVNKYLDKWHDRFYLFDDKYPFMQVLESDISQDKISRKNPSAILGKNINRLVSESGNKIALFSPKYGVKKNKEILKEDEIIRWLLVYHGYTGLSDKVMFGQDKYKASKGWLFDIGGLYLEGRNFFESLILNLTLIHPREEFIGKIQSPAWEYKSVEILDRQFSERSINNLAELYTIYSRAIYIDPNIDIKEAFKFDVIKLPDLDHQNQFLETMTLWRYNESGENKDTFTPRKHRANQSIWRSFGLITLNEGSDPIGNKVSQKRPGIMDWLIDIKDEADLNEINIKINAVSMQDDGNATSWVPTDEIYDSLDMKEEVLTDIGQNGWIERINDTVEETKRAVDVTYKRFLLNIKEIRNIKSSDFENQRIESFYYQIDKPFRDWLYSINKDDSKDGKIFEWRKTLKEIIKTEAKQLIENANNRDYMGIETKEGGIKNIATSYNSFLYFLEKQLSTKEFKENG